MEVAVLDNLIYDRFIRPTVDKPTRYVGVEFELPLVNLSPAPVDFSVVHALVDAFLRRFEFVPVATDDDGYVSSAQSEETGDDLSFDYSYNTLELSFGRVEDWNRIEQRFRCYYSISVSPAPVFHSDKAAFLTSSSGGQQGTTQTKKPVVPAAA